MACRCSLAGWSSAREYVNEYIPLKNRNTTKVAPDARPASINGRLTQPSGHDGKLLNWVGPINPNHLHGGMASGRKGFEPWPPPLLQPEPDLRTSLGGNISRSRLPQTVQNISGASASLASVVHWSGFPAPAIVRPAPSRMPCRSHCVQPRQAGGIHRHVAEIHLPSRRAPLSAGHIPPFPRSISQIVSNWKCMHG